MGSDHRVSLALVLVAADSITTREHGQFDETLGTPACAPGISDKPVGCRNTINRIYTVANSYDGVVDSVVETTVVVNYARLVALPVCGASVKVGHVRTILD